MKTKIMLQGAAMGIALLGLISCETELEPPVPVGNSIVQFAETAIRISENQAEKKIELKLSKPALQTGSVSLVLSSEHLAQFVTEPANTNGRMELPVIKGSTTIAFLLKPVNDTQSNGAKTLSVLIAEVSSGFQIGTQHALSVSVTEDDEPADERVEANFEVLQTSILENATGGSVMTVSLSVPAPAPGMLGIVYASDKLAYGVDFITEPALENSKIMLNLATGASQATFKVIPVNNQVFHGDRSVVFTLVNGQGSVRLGQQVVLQLNITDDETAPKIKGYETVGGGWRVKRLFEYDDHDNLVKTTWEQYTPTYQGGTYTYEYHQGRLHKMVENANRETYYLWEGDRIVKEEQYTQGLLTKYVLYHYDQAGNIGEAAYHYKQPDGSMKMGLLFVYLYFTDGNLYKKMVYNPREGSDDYSLISTITYDHYLDVENPFPVEIIPNGNAQPKLPGSYREEANGHDNLYSFTYEFDASGRPVKRTATSGMKSEITTYRYQ